MTPTLKYELELWINGSQVGDITRLAKNRQFSFTRNGSEELSFDMSLTAFEAYCAEQGAAPQAILEAYVTDIRVRRKGSYYFGVHVVDMQYSLEESGITLQVKATGFWDLFADRYVTKTYSQVDRTAIFLDLINETQDTGDPDDDFGVIPGPRQYATGFLSDREYVDQNVRDGGTNLTNLSDGNFDFAFNYDRSVETFAQIGSDRDTKFTYPYNVRSGKVAHTATNLWNYIIGLGSGFGEETLRTVTADPVSRGNYKTRQKIVSFNSVSEQQTLDENTYGYLQRVKSILELPTFNLSGALADLDVLGIGDRIPFEVVGHSALPINGVYRVEKLSVTLDDNDAEDIALTVDNYGL